MSLYDILQVWTGGLRKGKKMKNKKIITAALSVIVLETVLMSSSVFASIDR